jgi:hypothetical protein
MDRIVGAWMTRISNESTELLFSGELRIERDGRLFLDGDLEGLQEKRVHHESGWIEVDGDVFKVSPDLGSYSILPETMTISELETHGMVLVAVHEGEILPLFKIRLYRPSAKVVPPVDMSYDEVPVQMAIDPATGRDITAEVVSTRLKELEVIADEMIKQAHDELEKDPSKRLDIYMRTYIKIHFKLGHGSIGPATAAAGPLMYAKLEELSDLFKATEEERETVMRKLSTMDGDEEC